MELPLYIAYFIIAVLFKYLIFNGLNLFLLLDFPYLIIINGGSVKSGSASFIVDYALSVVFLSS